MKQKPVAFIYKSKENCYDWIGRTSTGRQFQTTGFHSVSSAATDAVTYGFCWVECSEEDAIRISLEWVMQ